MAADESDKNRGIIPSGGIIKPSGGSTGDPVRDAIIAQGNAEQSIRDLLYEANLEREKEALRAKIDAEREEAARKAAWRPPTEQEFNDDWATPDDALDVFGRSLDPIDRVNDRVRVLERLRGGLLVAVARACSIGSSPPRSFVPLPQSIWLGWQGEESTNFWEHGDAIFRIGGTTGYGDWTEHRCFDIRFDPASFSGRPPRVAPLEETILAPQKGLSIETAGTADDKPQLPKAEAERFCRAILSQWPQANEDWLREKAALFFPDHRFSRDWFRGILREIRGPVKRGKKPNPDN